MSDARKREREGGPVEHPVASSDESSPEIAATVIDDHTSPTSEVVRSSSPGEDEEDVAATVVQPAGAGRIDPEEGSIVG